jgi:hypothetical protein
VRPYRWMPPNLGLGSVGDEIASAYADERTFDRMHQSVIVCTVIGADTGAACSVGTPLRGQPFRFDAKRLDENTDGAGSLARTSLPTRWDTRVAGGAR